MAQPIMVSDAVLLVGGLAQRLGPITKVTNKHLLPVYDKPMIFHQLETLAYIGVTNVTIILGGNSVGDIVNLVKDGADFGLNITYKYQHNAGGISQAISLASYEIFSDYFIVLLGDNIFGDKNELRLAVARWTLEDDDTLIITTRVNNPWEYGQPLYSPDGPIGSFVEKRNDVGHSRIVTGFYGLPTYAFVNIRHQVPSARGELEITDTLNSLIENGIYEEEYADFWTDCGTPEGLAQASEYFRINL